MSFPNARMLFSIGFVAAVAGCGGGDEDVAAVSERGQEEAPV